MRRRTHRRLSSFHPETAIYRDCIQGLLYTETAIQGLPYTGTAIYRDCYIPGTAYRDCHIQGLHHRLLDHEPGPSI